MPGSRSNFPVELRQSCECAKRKRRLAEEISERPPGGRANCASCTRSFTITSRRNTAVNPALDGRAVMTLSGFPRKGELQSFATSLKPYHARGNLPLQGLFLLESLGWRKNNRFYARTELFQRRNLISEIPFCACSVADRRSTLSWRAYDYSHRGPSLVSLRYARL